MPTRTSSKKIFGVPNSISFGRILLIPVVLGLMVQDGPRPAFFAALLYFLAAMSDILDGLWARSRHSETTVGFFLDPLADKVLTLSVLIMLLVRPEMPDWLVVPVMLLLSREIAVSALRGVAASQDISLPTPKSEQTKTILQFIAVLFLLIRYPLGGIRFQVVGLWLLVMTVGVSLYSAAETSWTFARFVRQDESEIPRD